jgi:hypothetical protein
MKKKQDLAAGTGRAIRHFHGKGRQKLMTLGRTACSLIAIDVTKV